MSKAAPIDPQKFGVSFSRKQCRNFSIDAYDTLRWLIQDAGFRRLRLMSYWDEHEPEDGKYDFSGLDWQFELAEKYGCQITLCLGARQPRWPENHWPQWAWELPKAKRSEALLAFLEAVVERYKNSPALISYQLENEALLRKFGERPEIDRTRLRQEYSLVCQLDPRHPIAMSTSNGWGIPLRRPRPTLVGFSYYRTICTNGVYHPTVHTPLLFKTRARLIRALHRHSVFIHELQLEPWGPDAIWKLPLAEQNRSTGIAQIRKTIGLARKTKLYPIDLWGGEWWYWRLHHHRDPSIWQAVKESVYK